MGVAAPLRLSFTPPGALAKIEVDVEEAHGTTVYGMLLRGGLAAYEPETGAAILATLDHFKLTRFGDIGANFGLYSLIVTAVFGARVEVTAFEPMPELRHLAERLAKTNRLEYKLRPDALSNVDGAASFYISAKSDASNSLNAAFRKAKGVLEVSTRRLDSLAVEGFRPHVLKVDTESTEPDVLAGGIEYIRTERPYIICEVLAGRTEERLRQFVASVGYLSYHLTEDGIKGPKPIEGDPEHRHRDWLLAGSELPQAFIDAHHRWMEALKS